MRGDHPHIMRAALQLARRNLGQTWPNPSVGAIIVKDGHIIAQGTTARGGRPHAETEALLQAGAQAQGATLYVTLEPCSHQSQTPPCTEAIIAAKIATVIIACRDPNPLVNGQGIAQLKAAGIKIIENVCAPEATELNRGFFSVIAKKRPFISLKLATSLDGKIAAAKGESQWITGETARRHGHLLRSRYDAIATGIGTVLADDPLLTCRIPGLENRSPVRVVFDSKLQLPLSSKLVKTAKDVPVWALTSKADYSDAHVRILRVDGKTIDIKQAVELLAQQGITRLLVEAGAQLSTAFLQSGLVDRMYWFRAPVLIGNDGLAAVDAGFAQSLTQLARWKTLEHHYLHPDSLDILECLPA
jgi:diaminohydroxyphosphoribosylaminopyrimidine deaminase/5-amino-6-(5-phosphoribosylamino)uracil reductase